MYEAKATLKGIARDFKTGATMLTFSVDRCSDEVIEEMEKKTLRLTAKQWREKRSLDSNAYMWVLTDKIARALNSTTEDVHKSHIYQLNQPDLDDDTALVITVKACVDMDRVEGYWRYYSESDDGKWKSYYKLKSTRDFDSKEMSHFLQQIVIPDAKELGIETATPDELEQMEKLYEENLKKHNHRRS